MGTITESVAKTDQSSVRSFSVHFFFANYLRFTRIVLLLVHYHSFCDSISITLNTAFYLLILS